jgi:hypothetical protein
MRKPAGKQGYATFTHGLRLQTSKGVGGSLPPTPFCVNLFYASLRMVYALFTLCLRMVYA